MMKKITDTREPVIAAKRGKSAWKVVPAKAEGNRIFGFMADKCKVVGDVESPLVPLIQWKTAKK